MPATAGYRRALRGHDFSPAPAHLDDTPANAASVAYQAVSGRAGKTPPDSGRTASHAPAGLRPRNSMQVPELQFTRAAARGSVRRSANPLRGGGTGRPPASICWPFRRTPRSSRWSACPRGVYSPRGGAFLTGNGQFPTGLV